MLKLALSYLFGMNLQTQQQMLDHQIMLSKQSGQPPWVSLQTGTNYIHFDSGPHFEVSGWHQGGVREAAGNLDVRVASKCIRLALGNRQNGVRRGHQGSIRETSGWRQVGVREASSWHQGGAWPSGWRQGGAGWHHWVEAVWRKCDGRVASGVALRCCCVGVA